MGSPYEDECILALAGGWVQTGHPLNRGTVLRTPPGSEPSSSRSPPCSSRPRRRQGRLGDSGHGGRVVGNDPANRTASGPWPSDHGGAVMTLRLR
jgi:hypothetical protein